MDLFNPACVILLSLQLTASHVLPPTDVKLRCSNLQNTVEWKYEQLSPGLRFRVDVGSLKGLDANRSPLWVDSPTLQADVSFLSDPSDDYYLTVTAVIGLNASESVPTEGIIFSYFQNSQAEQKCSVDLPLVNITAKSEDTVLFRFNHPWLMYHQNLPSSSNPKPQKKKRHDADALIPEVLPLFQYDVVIINQAQDRHHDFSCEESVCEQKLPVDAAQEKHCLKITGELEKIRVKATQEYCALPFKEPDNIPIYIVVSLLVLAAFAVILFMVYQKKTQSSTPLPPSMTITGQVKQWTMGIVREQVSMPEPTSPSPLLTENEVNESTPVGTPCTEFDLRLPIGVSTQNDEVCDVTEVGQQKDEYMQGTNLDEDEFETSNYEAPSSYEKRHIVVELAPGEQAEGYRG